MALLCGAVHAQIRTDGSVGPAAQTLGGPSYVIPQTLGRLAGANLFHSFQSFNIGSGESATFTTATPGVANVISRVTGGGVSQINGLLQLHAASGAPAFFFINPAGITIGQGGRIDVPGALHLGTADALRFPDGRLYADPQKGSTFSSAAPEAFGFLGSSRAALTLKDGAVVAARLGRALSVAAGDVLIDSATLQVGGGGELRVAAVGQQSVDMPLAGPLPQGTGQLTVRNAGSVSTFASGDLAGGRLVLSAGDVVLDDGAYLYSRGPVAPADQGAGGDIELAVGGALSLTRGASISSDTAGAGRAGTIRIQADQVLLDTGAYVYSSAAAGSTGSAGGIALAAKGSLTVGTGASVSSSAFGAARSDALQLSAANLTVDGGYVLGEGGGGAAPVSVAVGGTLALVNAGHILTSTDGSADAGAIDVRAGSLRIEGKGYIGSLAAAGQGASGSVGVAVAGDALLSSGGWIFSSSASAGRASNVNLSAANLQLDSASVTSNAVGTGAAGAGNIDVAVSGQLTLRNASSIDTSTLTHGSAGNLRVRARDVVLTGASRIDSRALDGSGSAGAVDVAAVGTLVLRENSSLSTSSATAGDAGAIKVSASSITLDTGAAIDSTAGLDSQGRGGSVSVGTPGALSVQGGAHITAITAGTGNAGNVQIDAGSVSLDSRGYVSSASDVASPGNAGRVALRTAGDLSLRNGAFVNSDAFGLGDAGEISIQARNITLDSAGRISSVTYTGSAGRGGRVDLQASDTLLLANSSGDAGQAGQISTSTFSSGNGGAVLVRAGNVRVDGPGAGIAAFAQVGSTGNAGSIDVQTTGDLVMARGGQITSSTAAAGNGGPISVRSANVLIDGTGAGVVSFSRADASGAAGSIDVRASGDLTIRNGGLSTSTFSRGPAGSVHAEAARVVITGSDSGISAAEAGGLSGQTGSVTVLASERITLREGGYVSIGNRGVVSNPAGGEPTALRLVAPEIVLQGAVVTAAADGNVAASTIGIEFTKVLAIDGSAITTSANNGNGGAIRIHGGDAASLRRSQVTTSVLGTAGNGGDIDISAGALALDSGFIQANTAARDASGGLVRIAVDSLVASGNTLFLGGNTVLAFRPEVAGFNVIQAAAPTGVSGVVDVTSPVLDVTGSLRVLRGDVIDAAGLGRSLCQASAGSTLARSGRGGMVASSRGLLRAEPVGSAQVAVAPPAGTPGLVLHGPSAARGSTAVPVTLASSARGCL